MFPGVGLMLFRSLGDHPLVLIALAALLALPGSVAAQQSAEPATLSDMDSIGLFQGNPVVPVGPPGAWDEHIRQIGNVLYEPWNSGKEYKLFYSGYSGSYTGVTYIGYATSSDGIHWTKVGKIIPGATLEGPYVLNVSGVYYLYATLKVSGHPAGFVRYHASNPAGSWTYDGIVFNSQGNGWEAKLVSAPVVWKEGATWYMLYEGDGYSASDEGVGLATSSDGRSWQRNPTNPVIRKGQFTWFTGNIAPDDIIKVDGTYYLFYHGIFGPSGDSDTGIATSTDLVNWTDSPRSPFVPLDGGYASTTMVMKDSQYVLYYQPRPVGDNMGIYRGYPAKRVQLPTVSASPVGGTYSDPQWVVLTASVPATIYYTLDGTTPTAASATYTGPIQISSTATLKFIAVGASGNQSAVGTETYTIDTVPPTVAANPPGGLYATAQSVTLAATDNLDPAPKVYYTTDGSAPTPASQPYTAPIGVASTTTIRYVAVDAAGNQSSVGSQTYTIDTVPPTVAANPPGGIYNSPQSVTLTAHDDVDPAPKVHYKIDDGVAATGWQPYSGPINVGTTCTVSFLAIDEAGNESAVGSAAFTIDTVAPTVSASPSGGVYATQQSVTITSSEPGVIYYTTDGSAPDPATSANGPSPIAITTQGATTTLKFLAVDLAGNRSEVRAETYIVDDTAPSVTASPPGGTYDAPQSVTLMATDNVDPTPMVYYTTDGSAPTPSGTLYSSPVQITDNCVLRFIAVDAMGNRSPIQSQSYTIKVAAPTVTVSPPGGVYGTPQTVTLTSDKPATIYYTTDGSVPTTETPTSGPSPVSVTIASSAVLRAIAVDKHGAKSTVVTEAYTIDTEPPTVTATPSGGWYRNAQSVSLAATDNTDQWPRIYYTTDGSEPTTDSSLYVTPIAIGLTTTLRYMAVDDVGNQSGIGSQTYSIDTVAPSVVASPPGGTYESAQSVALAATDDLDQAPRVYYTLDGSDPTSASAPYTSPIDVQSSTTIRYVAVDLAGNQSPIGSQTYTIVPPVALSEMDAFGLSAGNPVVPVGPPGAWDEHIRQIGNVLYEPWDVGKEYKLFYSGYSGSYTGVTYIGYATSSDGIHWTKQGKIVPGSPLEGPYVVNDGDTYYLYAISVPGGRESGVARYHAANPLGTWVYDGIVFNSQGTGWEGKLVSAPVVWKEGATWYMLYEGDGYAYPYEGIGLATSSDGKTWMRSLCNPVMQKGQFGWFTGSIAPDDITKVDGTYYLFYHGIFGPSGDCDTGIATSTDLVNWADCPLSPFTPLEGGYSVTTMVARGPRYVLYYQPRPVGDNMGIYRAYPIKRLQAPTVSANPPGGTYASAQQVVLSASKPSIIYYTTDGTAPTTSSASGPSPVRLNVEANTTIRSMAIDPLGNQSAVRTETYTINYPPKVITVAFRYDDFGQRSTPSFEIPLMDTFQRHRVPVSVAVIPYVCAGDSHDLSPQATLPLTPEKAAILMPGLANGTVEVALHGYSHQTTRVPDYTEFQGLPYDEQLRRLTDGKALLEALFSVPITTFVPPWNNYDSNTLYALNALGFSVLSAGPPPGTTVGLAPMKSIPENCGTPDVKARILAARASSDPSPLLVVMMHPDEFIEEWPEGGWNSLLLFDSLLSWISSQPDVQTKTLAQVAAGM